MRRKGGRISTFLLFLFGAGSEPTTSAPEAFRSTIRAPQGATAATDTRSKGPQCIASPVAGRLVVRVHSPRGFRLPLASVINTGGTSSPLAQDQRLWSSLPSHRPGPPASVPLPLAICGVKSHVYLGRIPLFFFGPNTQLRNYENSALRQTEKQNKQTKQK